MNSIPHNLVTHMRKSLYLMYMVCELVCSDISSMCSLRSIYTSACTFCNLLKIVKLFTGRLYEFLIIVIVL